MMLPIIILLLLLILLTSGLPLQGYYYFHYYYDYIFSLIQLIPLLMLIILKILLLLHIITVTYYFNTYYYITITNTNTTINCTTTGPRPVKSFLNNQNNNLQAVSLDVTLDLYKILLKTDEKKADTFIKESVSVLQRELEMKLEMEKKDIETKLGMEKKDIEIKLGMKELEKKAIETKLGMEKKDIEIKLVASEVELKYISKELLSVKGLLTSRGIFEFYITLCFGELQKLGICGEKEKLNYTQTINKMYIMENRKKLPDDGPCVKLLNAADKCKVHLLSVYTTLCNEIHGGPWSGPGVQVLANKMSIEDKCIIEFIAEDMKLRVNNMITT